MAKTKLSLAKHIYRFNRHCYSSGDMKLMHDRVINKTFCEAYSDARKEDSETQDN